MPSVLILKILSRYFKFHLGNFQGHRGILTRKKKTLPHLWFHPTAFSTGVDFSVVDLAGRHRRPRGDAGAALTLGCTRTDGVPSGVDTVAVNDVRFAPAPLRRRTSPDNFGAATLLIKRPHRRVLKQTFTK